MWKSKGIDHVVACVLRGVRARIADERMWTQCRNASDILGYAVWATSPQACQWCIEGAILAEVRVEFDLADKVRDALRRASYGESLNRFNDTRGHRATLALIDRALAYCRERAA